MNQVWFEAADEDAAKALMEKVQNEDINISDLPNYQERNRGIELDFSDSILESE
jgi:hypothetical protein